MIYLENKNNNIACLKEIMREEKLEVMGKRERKL